MVALPGAAEGGIIPLLAAESGADAVTESFADAVLLLLAQETDPAEQKIRKA